MIKIINKDYPLRREEVTREEAERRIRELDEPYKLEILDAIKEEPITIYDIGDEWWDLCAGPHVESTKKIHPKAIDLESVAGAYWRGDETKPMLQRIYGTAWGSPEEMKAYNDFKAEAARRDHRKVGKELDLFSIQQEEVGGGLVFWHPKGARMRNMIENFWKDTHLDRAYELLYTPHVGKLDLWQTSGHADFYGENMYKPIDVEDETYQLKPMNCPFHVAVYKDGYFSYRDLPIRWAELGTVYRYERSGTMHGLFRVRGFTQDDAHIFCLPDQIAGEIKGVLDLTEEIPSTFGFTDFEVNLSTKPEKSVGGPEIWDKAEGALKEALADKGWDYEVDEGGGAFYGPKIDIKILDAIGRKWQCSTVQLDFNLPERFDLNYVDKENAKQRPIMIHRAIFGSLERFWHPHRELRRRLPPVGRPDPGPPPPRHRRRDSVRGGRRATHARGRESVGHHHQRAPRQAGAQRGEGQGARHVRRRRAGGEGGDPHRAHLRRRGPGRVPSRGSDRSRRRGEPNQGDQVLSLKRE